VRAMLTSSRLISPTYVGPCEAGFSVSLTAHLCVRVRRLILPVAETTSDIDTLQSDILDIIGRSSIITPDDLRGNASTLQEALTGSGG